MSASTKTNVGLLGQMLEVGRPAGREVVQPRPPQWPSANSRSTSVEPMNPAAPVTSARTGPPYRRAARRTVLALAAAALIAVQLVVRAVLAFGGYFYWDDLILIGRAGTHNLLRRRTCSTTTTGTSCPAPSWSPGRSSGWRR